MTGKELTLYLAELSMIEFTEKELIKMTKDISGIMELMDKVCGFDAGQEHFALSPSPYGQLRKDQPGPSSPPEQILSNAKKTARNCFTVPKVI